MKGVYKIENLINNKIYIGSSENVERRFTDHKYLLRKNIHHSVLLQRSWNKYGEDIFKFEAIEECENILEREQYWMNLLLKADEYLKGESNFFIKNGYNILPKSIKGFSGKMKKESIIKGMKSSGRFDPILRISKDGIILNKYEFQKQCPDNRWVVAKSLNTGNTIIKGTYGYIRLSKYKEGWKPKIPKLGNRGVKNTWTKGSEVYVYDIYLRFVGKFKSLGDTAKYFERDKSSFRIIDDISKPIAKIQGYYLFSYKQQDFENTLLKFDSKPDIIEVYSVFDEFLGYSNSTELSGLLKCHKNSINAVLNGRRKQISGYILKKHKDIV